MTQVPATPPTTPPTTSGVVRCVQCGYDLTGLPPEGKCPECSNPVANSLRGRLLVYSTKEYVASLHKGVFLIVAGIIAQVLLVFLMIAVGLAVSATGGGGGFVMSVAALLMTAVAFALLVGWWMFSAPDPSMVEDEKGTSARKIIRAAIIAEAVMAVLNLVFELTGAVAGAALAVGLFGYVVTAVKFFAAMLYIRWLAPRLPDPAVQAKAGKYMWILPLLSTVGVLIIIGPLIALVLYWNLLDSIRKRLKQIRVDQGALPPA